MRKGIEFTRDAPCRAILLQSNRPIAYTDHPDTTPINSLLIPDSTMTVLEEYFRGMDKKNYRFWAKPEEVKVG